MNSQRDTSVLLGERHLSELAVLLHGQTRLPPEWSRAADGTICMFEGDDATFTTSGGIAVMATAFIHDDRVEHYITFIDTSEMLPQTFMADLARALVAWLGVRSPEILPSKETKSAAVARFGLTRAAAELLNRSDPDSSSGRIQELARALRDAHGRS